MRNCDHFTVLLHQTPSNSRTSHPAMPCHPDALSSQVKVTHGENPSGAIPSQLLSDQKLPFHLLTPGNRPCISIPEHETLLKGLRGADQPPLDGNSGYRSLPGCRLSRS